MKTEGSLGIIDNKSGVYLDKTPSELVERLNELGGNFSRLVSNIPGPFYGPSRDLIKEMNQYKAKKRKLISSFKIERKRLISSFDKDRKEKLDKLTNYFNRSLSKINAKEMIIKINKDYYKTLRKSKCRNDLISLQSKYKNRIL